MKRQNHGHCPKLSMIAALLLTTVNLSACGNNTDEGPIECIACNEDPVVTISPDRTSVLRNPLNGWVAYMNRDADDKYWDGLDDIYVPDLGKTIRMSDYASTAYVRTSWASLNPAEGVYTWRNPASNLTKAIQAAWDRGMTVAFRIVVDGRDQGLNTPQWVFDKGITYYLASASYPNRRTPYPQDPVFQEYYEKFIRELAKDFNDPDKCAFIDAYGLGKWGEAHNVIYEPVGERTTENTEELKEEVIDWVVDLYSTCFTKVPLVINYHRLLGHPQSEGSPNPNSERLLDKMVEKGYSLRHDAFGMTNSNWGYSTWEKNYATKMKYKRPIIMEGGWITINHSHPYEDDPSGKYIKGQPGTVRQGEFDEAMNACVNMMDFRAGGEGQTWFTYKFDLVQRFISEGGYRLYPDRVSFPENVAMGGEEVTLTHRWRNIGWGYCPNNIPQWNYKYKVAFAILDSSDKPVKIFVDVNSEPSEWLESPVSYTFKTEVKGVSVGYYNWAIAIVDTSKTGSPPGIQLAVDRSKVTADGWFKIGGFSLVAK